MTSTLILFITILILNIISNCIGTLKSIFVVKQIGGSTYWLVALDALFFSLILKAFDSGDGFFTIIAFVLGKVLGTVLADLIEKKLAIGLLEVEVHLKVEDAILIADILREMDYSVTTFKGYGKNGKGRLVLNISILRKELTKLKELFSKYGIENPNLTIKELKSVEGKCGRRIK